MREAAFLKQNAAKWKEYETNPTSNADELAKRFIDVTDDLAYARTFYKNSETTQYINGLAQSLHLEIYKNKKEGINRFVSFWKTELPFTIKQNHSKLFYSFLIFTLAVLLGAFSASVDENFVRMILGDSYVNMTIENIKNGKPMAVYNSESSGIMFLSITKNNITVSFYAFVAGILLSYGTFVILISNGIMLGAFQFFFFKYGYLLTSVLSIWIHGTIEIASIIIAGAGGFCLGNSMLFPGTYSRLQSFKRGSKSGLKIVVGLVPLFIIAGLLESFVTRHADVSRVLSASIIIVSGLFILWYFIFYPYQVSKKLTNGITT